jgi:glycosyltransferase involved in cell wall biosynthesis
MNILTHAVHTGYQFDLAKSGHEFYSLEIPGSQERFWDTQSRPLPKNYHRVKFKEELPAKMDLALVHFEFGYHCLKHTNLPIVFKEHCIREPFVVPVDWIDRIAHYSFASQTAAARWKMPAEVAQRVSIIGMGMDLQMYGGYSGTDRDVLAVGQNIRLRGNEKGYDNLLRLAQKFPVSVVGTGNGGIPGAIGRAADYDELLRHYQSHRVFLNPSNTLGMSTLEAMATGMPVVSFRMINSDIVQNGVNGFVVDSVEEAELALEKLLRNPILAQEMGRAGRSLVGQRFRMESFIQRWNTLFQSTVERHTPGSALENWPTRCVGSGSPEAQRLAEALVRETFEYCRVGFDNREMTFQPNGKVGKGAGGRELFWDLKIDAGIAVLEIFSGSELTCSLKRGSDGRWRGQWNRFEKMPIVLTPHPPHRLKIE